MLSALTATHRFGFGPARGDLQSATADPTTWLLDQRTPAPPLGPSTEQVVDTFRRLHLDAEPPERREAEQQAYKTAVQRWLEQDLTTDAPFRSRWTAFWLNTLTVSVRRPQVRPAIGPYLRDAIRPHVWSRFDELLAAVTRHPAMLLYLDNHRSVGPRSAAGQRRGIGLNENHARELLELHTLGVGNYGQADVEGLAAALTGWTVPREAKAFAFDPRRHEPGTKAFLGHTLPEGEAGGIEALQILARHPATAKRIARRLAAHFVADDPPEALVTSLEQRFIDTRGDLSELAHALVTHPDAQTARPQKLRSPWELTMVTARSFERPVDEVAISLRVLGQVPFTAASPEGWPDTEAEWSGPQAVLDRVRWSVRAGRQIGDGTSLERLLSLSERTQATLVSARRPERRLALLLMSPEVQRR